MFRTTANVDTQRFGMANLDPSAENSSSHLIETQKGAKNIVEERVLAGEELMHPGVRQLLVCSDMSLDKDNVSSTREIS